MMGPTHAATGAAAGTGLYTALAATGHPVDMWHAATVVAVATGAALLPDIDHPNSTATHAAGPATRAVSWAVRKLSRAVCRATSTPRDDIDGEHRALTHTALGAAVAGAGAAAASAASQWAAFAVVALTGALALRGAASHFAPDIRQRSAATWAGVTALSALGAAALVLVPDDPAPAWVIGAALALGMVVHDLGDVATKAPVPLLWPLRIAGKRWYGVNAPRIVRFPAGAPVEWWIAWAAWLAAGAGAVVMALG